MCKNFTENKDMCFIYQLKEDAGGLLFLSMDRLKSKGSVIEFDNYKLVYSEEYKGLDLNQIYEKFNIDHPEDFKGHSLSVGDIVVLRRNGVAWAYFVDDFGFQDVSLEFLTDLEEFAVEAADRYFLIQRVDGGWDYSVCDEKFCLLDGGVLEDDDEFCLREALNEIIQDAFDSDFLKGKMVDGTKLERVDYEWALERMEEAENAKFANCRFTDKTPENICNILKNKGYNAELHTYVKNGVSKIAVTIREDGLNVSPIIYLEDLINSSQSLERVVDMIITVHEKNKGLKIDVSSIWNKENVLKNVRIGLQRAGNEPLVKKSGFPMAEMEAYLYLTGKIGDVDSYTIRIFRESFEKVEGVSLAELWDAAELNTFADVYLCPMNNFLENLGILSPGASTPNTLEEFYVLTNEGGDKGAAQILNERYLRAFASQEGWKQVIAIPSSIHEFLLIPYEEKGGRLDLRYIKELVPFVNNTELKAEEQLSDRAYILDFSDAEKICWNVVK